MHPQKSSIRQTIEGDHLRSWVSIFLDYLNAKARLVAAESREASAHFIAILVLIGVILVLSLSSVLMYGACLLYLVGALFRLPWGWSALICGGFPGSPVKLHLSLEVVRQIRNRLLVVPNAQGLPRSPAP
jgi:hypothetical protein